MDFVSPHLQNRRVLIVEDQLVIAMDLGDMLAAAGAAEVEIAGTLAEARSTLARVTPDFALLDVQIGPDASFSLADQFAAAGTPFLFVTAYSEASAIPSRFAAIPRLFKPFDQRSVEAAISLLAKAS